MRLSVAFTLSNFIPRNIKSITGHLFTQAITFGDNKMSSSSSSNLPAIILALVAIIILGGFYYMDRSSGSITNVAAITETADTEGMIASKKKYEADKSAFSHSGYSGSMDDYLAKTADGNEPAEDVKAHSGYSGSSSDYAKKHGGNEVAQITHNAGEHSGFSGSMKDYAAGKFDTHSTTSSKPAKKTMSKSSSSSSNSGSHSGYTGSVDDYMSKYK